MEQRDNQVNKILFYLFFKKTSKRACMHVCELQGGREEREGIPICVDSSEPDAGFYATDHDEIMT